MRDASGRADYCPGCPSAGGRPKPDAPGTFIHVGVSSDPKVERGLDVMVELYREPTNDEEATATSLGDSQATRVETEVGDITVLEGDPTAVAAADLLESEVALDALQSVLVERVRRCAGPEGGTCPALRREAVSGVLRLLTLNEGRDS